MTMSLRARMIVRFLITAFGLYLLSALFLLCLLFPILHVPENVSIESFRWVWICSIPIGFVTAYFPCSLDGFPRWGWFVSVCLILVWDVCVIGMLAVP